MKASNSKDLKTRMNIPKHLKDNQVIKKQQQRKKEEKQSNFQAGIVLVLIAVLLGAGLFVYNMDNVYLQDKNNITMSFSNNFQQGGEAPVLITLSDFDGTPTEDQEVTVELRYTQENKSVTKVLGEQKTDESGTIAPILKLPDDFNGTADLVVVVNDQEIIQPIMIDEPIIGTNKQDEERLKILISTDKPLYQPGQTINIRTLAMFGETKGVYDEEITVEVDDPDGNKLMRDELECNSYGIASTNFTVTDQMTIGNYKIIAKVGEKESKKSVTIKEYVLPRFNIKFQDVKNWYTVDEDIVGSVNTKYFFGKPVKGNFEFTVRTSYGGIWDQVYHTTGLLTEDGEFQFTVPAINYAVGLPINQDNGLVELNATITDPSGHSETKLMPVSIAKKAILISAISDTNIDGADSNYYILTQSPDGSIIDNANISAKLDGTSAFDGKTDGKGLAQVSFEYTGQEELEVAAEKGSSSATETFALKPHTGIKIAVEKMYYSVGETAKFTVFYTGESFTKWTYYDVLSAGFTVTTGAFKLSSMKAGTGSFSIDLTPEMVGTTYVRVYKIEKDEDVVNDRIALAVAPVSQLEVDIEKDDEIYNPNQPVKLVFKVTEGTKPVQGAIGVSIIDQSLYALTERFGGFEDIYFEMEETALEPRYQVWEYVFSADGDDGVIPLPATNVLDPSDYEEGYSYPKIGIQSNWNVEQKNAEQERTDYINMFWAGIFIVVFISIAVLMFFGIRKSKGSLVLALLIILVATTVIGAVGLNMSGITEEDDDDDHTHRVALYGEKETSKTADQDTDDDGMNDTQEPPNDAMDKAGGGDGGGWEFDEGMDDWERDFDDGLVIPTAESNDKDYGPDSDMNMVPDEVDDPKAKRDTTGVHIREYFPETWYWNPVLITDESGTATIDTLTTPDSITTWEIKAVASTKSAKIGVNNENLTVFQQFFIEPDIPISVVRNDTFPLRIMVYNYDNLSHEVTVYLNNEDATWYEVLDETTKKVTVPSDNVSKVMFNIRALEVGEHNVSVSGYNGKVWDDVIKPMRVDPDGKRDSRTFNGKLTDNQTVKETIIKSELRVPKSENAFVKLQGGVEAVLLDGAEEFIRHVSGCGEQSMSTLNIDILAFDTVVKVGTATEEKMFEYEGIVTQGIQHEMQYLVEADNKMGRGIVWFPSDSDVHQWLTSWGLITFQDAIDAGFEIDDDIIDDMQSWLLSQQEDDGSFVFPERGLYEFTNPILRAKTVSCSAYITRSLIYSGYSPSSTAIQDAVDYIEDHAKDEEVWDDPYTLSLVLTVLADANGDSTLQNELATRLDELKVDDVENGTAYWTSGNSMITDSDDMFMEMDFGRGFGYGSNYHSIETTGYAIMALAKSKNPGYTTVQKGIKYLINNRQGLGGWYSTQDTVVAFQALKSAGINNVDELTVEVRAGSKSVKTIEFTEKNIDLTYLIDLRPYLNENTEVSIQSTGSGSVMYQIYYEEFIPWALIGVDEPDELKLTIDYDTTDIKVNDKIKAELELKYMGSAKHIKMVLVDVRAPVGFSFVVEDFEAMKTDGVVSMYEINERQAYLYIEDLAYGEILKVTYHLEANDPIRGTIQGVQAYDMYNPDLTVELEPVQITATD